MAGAQKIHGTLDGESHHTPIHEDSKQVFAKKPERLSLKNNQAASQMRRYVVLKPFQTRSYLQDQRGYCVEILELFDVRTKRMLFTFPCLCNWRRTSVITVCLLKCLITTYLIFTTNFFVNGVP